MIIFKHDLCNRLNILCIIQTSLLIRKGNGFTTSHPFSQPIKYRAVYNFKHNSLLLLKRLSSEMVIGIGFLAINNPERQFPREVDKKRARHRSG